MKLLLPPRLNLKKRVLKMFSEEVKIINYHPGKYNQKQTQGPVQSYFPACQPGKITKIKINQHIWTQD